MEHRAAAAVGSGEEAWRAARAVLAWHGRAAAVGVRTSGAATALVLAHFYLSSLKGLFGTAYAGFGFIYFAQIEAL